MPKTVISINSTMRDHTMSLPAPENTVAFNIPNACTECHADRKATWAVAVLDAWWPKGRRSRLVERARAFSGGRRGEPAALNGLLALAGDADAGPLIQATAVGYLRRYSGAPVRAALRDAAASDHPAIRAAAIASLGDAAAGADEAVQSTLVAALSDRRRAVRISALVSLINVHGRPLAPPDQDRLQSVAREYSALTTLYADDAGFDRDLGMIQLLAGEFVRAAEMLEISLRLNPAQPSAGFVLALARLGQGRVDEARSLLQRVPPSDPSYVAAQRRLALLAR
jgi:tetratricopeptide (TPR) repeat protein